MNKDSRLFGFVLGCIIPVLAYIIIDQVFELLSAAGIMAQTSGEGISRRLRTIGLLAICANLLAFNWAKNNRYDYTMQGTVFPTIIYVGAWVYRYYNVLF